MEQLTGQDASFVFMEHTRSPMHIGGIAIYDPSTAPGGHVRFKDILAALEARLHLVKSFRQKMIRLPGDIDNPYWIEDPDFDLEYHVRHIALPAPGDWRQLCIQAARLHSRPLDMNKPLWEMYVIEGLNNVKGLPAGCFAVFSKTHHAAIDGVSGMDVTSVIHTTEPDAPNPAPPEKEWKGEQTPNIGELLWRTHLNNLAQPWRLARTLVNAAPGWQRLNESVQRREITVDNRPAPRTRFQGRVSSHRVIDGIEMPMDDIRAIRPAVPGSTVNDVALAIVGGALRKYLEAKGELPKDPMSAMAPISVRTEGEKGALGNQVSAMIVSLATNIADPLERLSAVHASTTNSKAMTNAVGARTLSEYSNLMPSALAGLGGRLFNEMGASEQMQQNFNTVVTNVPGPRVTLYFVGAQLLKVYGSGPVSDGMGIIHPVTSYNDEMFMSFTSDRDMMPDPGFYADCMRESVEELKAAAKSLGQSAPAAASKPAAAKKAGEKAAEKVAETTDQMTPG